MLEITGLVGGYGRVDVLFGVDLSIDSGEIVCLIGPNGAGKTSLLRAISGMLKVSSGQVSLAGKDVTARRPHEIVRLGVGHCPEGRELFSDMTVMDNLTMGAVWKGDRDYRRRRIEVMFEAFPILAEKRHVAAEKLSGGQQQMLAIARALMPEPSLLLLDEPSDGLAPKIVEELIESILNIRRAGTTVLLVEQDAGLALEVADRAYVLENGRVAISGLASELRFDPRVRDSYLGQGNGEAPLESASDKTDHHS
ncbi:MAG TPA: ABC transporter ATP-binding protein [Candidatus Dormibacteraeota bacterium]|nr:ABC transporter ATP-binding protein [Candidatus Dormibacteraeota bacterium]